MARLRREWGIQSRPTAVSFWRPFAWGWGEAEARRYVADRSRAEPDCIRLVSRVVGDAEVVPQSPALPPGQVTELRRAGIVPPSDTR